MDLNWDTSGFHFVLDSKVNMGESQWNIKIQMHDLAIHGRILMKLKLSKTLLPGIEGARHCQAFAVPSATNTSRSVSEVVTAPVTATLLKLTLMSIDHFEQTIVSSQNRMYIRQAPPMPGEQCAQRLCAHACRL